MRRTIQFVLAIALLSAAATLAAQTPVTAPVGAVTLDRVAAVVNNQAILRSDVEEELLLAVLDPALAAQSELSPQQALEQLISRALIQQQIHREEALAADPTDDEVRKRTSELRRELPACVHSNCASDEGWAAFLAAHGLTPERVESSLRNRVEILRFIEVRFRSGLSIPSEEIESYYRQTLLPQYKPGEAVPKLDAVSQRIEEILLEKRVNALFEEWLENLRKQGDVEVLDPELEPAPSTPVAAQQSGAADSSGKELHP